MLYGDCGLVFRVDTSVFKRNSYACFFLKNPADILNPEESCRLQKVAYFNKLLRNYKLRISGLLMWIMKETKDERIKNGTYFR
jgi:hypothetical protein